jgi:CRP-like cAMP-binding protein
MLLLGSMNADERLSMFLLNLSQRLAARGYSPSEFNLRMTRDDIGSYLCTGSGCLDSRLHNQAACFRAAA